MKTRLMKATLVVGLLLLGGVGSAYAGSFTFNFGTGGCNLAGNANSTAITSCMNGVLSTGGSTATVTVKGGVGDYDGTSSTPYTGDGHVVVGPGSGSNSYTLRNKDGGTFIINSNGLNGLTTSSDILMTFTGLTVTSVSFDFEIFPDGSCPALSSANCGGSPTGGIYPNQPDLILKANGSTVQTWYGATPSGTYVNSPAGSAVTGKNPETAPQLIGSSGVITLGAGVTTLDFVDWPATIGIANLQINTPPTQNPPVPEPASLLLFGTGLLGGAGVFKRKIRG